MLSLLIKELKKASNPKQAELLQRYFKTGKGQYGEGDIFIGLKVWEIRKIAKKYEKLKTKDIQELLNSKIHEHRLVGLLILINKYNKASLEDKKKIFYFYLNNTKKINNWDLVDLSAPNIVGDFLLDNYDKKQLIYNLAQSDNIWKKRIAIISTFAFIRKDRFDDSLAIAEILMNDTHDLIHKAVGWMLRETGKRNQEILEEFLKKHYKNMPRTMLRYSIERFDEKKRRMYLKGDV